MLDRTTHVVSIEDYTVADLGEESVVLDVSSGKYFGLNEIGVRILELTRQPVQVGSLLETLGQEYDATADQIERDVLAFLEQLVGSRLLKIADEH